MRLKLLYTLTLIFCMSAYASSNERAQASRTGHVRVSASKGIQDVSEEGQPTQEESEYPSLRMVKFLYI